MMKIIKQSVLILFLGLTLTFSGFAGDVDLSQGGKKRETPKEKRKESKDDKGDRDRGKRDGDRDKDKKGKRKNDD
ncbi:MAG: hypothetical protein L0220_09745 [Acidobacteria bacterium]|nr:hypothetical protein [Acidobacteriota bacterium]